MEQMESLQNHFLIAMPDLNDAFFQRTVTYICEHNHEGAMGLVINHPIDLKVAGLLEKLEIDVRDEQQRNLSQQVFAGGPLAQDRGFLLHPPTEKKWRSSQQLSEDICITTSTDALIAIGQGLAPENFVVALGYAGWEAGQLEQEISENSWLTIPADANILFATPSNERWQKATSRLGIDVWQLAPGAGHA